MKKVLLTAVCFSVMALGALNVQAADDMPLPPPPPHHGDEMLPPPPPPGADKAMEKKMEKMEKKMSKKLADDLGLTKEQQEQAEKIRKEGREKLKPLFEEMKDIREKMDKLREDNMLEFEKILTPEQKEKLKDIKARHHEARHDMRRDRHEKKLHDVHDKD